MKNLYFKFVNLIDTAIKSFVKYDIPPYLDEPKPDTHISYEPKFSSLKDLEKQSEKFKNKLSKDEINLIDDILNRDEEDDISDIDINVQKCENYSNTNINLMLKIKDKYPEKFPQELKKHGNNVIYYDQNFEKRTKEIFDDSEKFKINTNGAFIFVTNKQSLFYVLKELKKLNTKCKFDLFVMEVLVMI